MRTDRLFFVWLLSIGYNQQVLALTIQTHAPIIVKSNVIYVRRDRFDLPVRKSLEKFSPDEYLARFPRTSVWSTDSNLLEGPSCFVLHQPSNIRFLCLNSLNMPPVIHIYNGWKVGAELVNSPPPQHTCPYFRRNRRWISTDHQSAAFYTLSLINSSYHCFYLLAV